MAVDLSDLVDSLKREVNAPGLNQLPNARDVDYLGNLQDAFWEAFLDGVISGYTETDGIVTPTSGTTDIPKEIQQLIVFYAGFRIVRNLLRDIKTAFKAQAGPVDYEVQQSAMVLTRLMDDLRERRAIILSRLGDIGNTSSVYIDGVAARSQAIAWGDIDWLR